MDGFYAQKGEGCDRRISCCNVFDAQGLAGAAEEIDYFAVYDPMSQMIFFVSIEEAKEKCVINLRVAVPKNNQHTKVHFAKDYTEIY